MNKEDYNKYYIQGSDHYLIPKDVFIELFSEMENWREEVKELKKQLEEKNNSQIFIDTQDMEERYAEGLYMDYLKEENKELKDNWNYIKKMLKEVRQEKFNVNGYCGTCTDVDIDFLLNKMQELEGSDNK